MNKETELTFKITRYLWLSLINFKVWSETTNLVLFCIAFVAQFMTLYGVVDGVKNLLKLMSQ